MNRENRFVAANGEYLGNAEVTEDQKKEAEKVKEYLAKPKHL